MADGTRHARRRRCRAGFHVRYRGEDVARGDVLAPAGAPLTMQRVTALASAGVGDGGRAPPAGRARARDGQRAARGRRRARARPDPRVQPAHAAPARRGAPAPRSCCTPSCPTTATPPAPPSRPRRAATSCSSPAACRSARTTTSSRRSRRPACARTSGASGSSRASRSGSGGATTCSCSACRATRSPPSPASCSSSAPALRRLQGEAGAAPAFVPVRLAVPARPADGRTTLLTSRARPGAGRRARGDADRGPGLAPDGRARRLGRVRGHPPRRGRAPGGDAASTRCCCRAALTAADRVCNHLVEQPIR